MAVERNPRNDAARRQRQRDPPHHARPLPLAVDEEHQVQAARERTQIRYARAHRPGNPHLPGARREPDVAAQGDRIEQRDRTPNIRADIDVRIDARIARSAPVQLGRVVEHRNGRRRALRQVGQKLLRNLEHLLPHRRVEHHLHRARQRENVLPNTRPLRRPRIRVVRTRAHVQCEGHGQGDPGDARRAEGGVNDEQPLRLAPNLQGRNRGVGVEEHLEPGRRNPQEEYPAHRHHVRRVRIRRSPLFDPDRSPNRDRERLRRQLEGPQLRAQIHLVVRAVELDEVNRAVLLGPVVVHLRDQLPLPPRDDGLHPHSLEGQVLGYQRIQRALPCFRNRNVSQRRRRQRRDRKRQILAIRHQVARNALEEDLLRLDRRRGVDLQRGAAVHVQPEVLQEVEVRLDPRHPPQFWQGRRRVAHLEHKPRARRPNVAQLDDLDRPAGVQREPRHLPALRQDEVPELEDRPTPDVDDRLVGEAQPLQLHAPRDLHEEDLAHRLRRPGSGVIRDRLDHLETLAARCPRVPNLVAPRALHQLNRHPTRHKPARQVEPVDILVGFVDLPVPIIVHPVARRSQLGRGLARHRRRPHPTARQRQLRRPIQDRVRIQRHPARHREAHVNPRQTLPGPHGQRPRLLRQRDLVPIHLNETRAPGNQLETQRPLREGPGVEVAELGRRHIQQHRGLTLVQRERDGRIRRAAHRDLELRIQIRKRRHIHRHRTARQPEGHIDKPAMVQQAAVHGRIAQRFDDLAPQLRHHQGLDPQPVPDVARGLNPGQVVAHRLEGALGEAHEQRARREIAAEEVAVGLRVRQPHRPVGRRGGHRGVGLRPVPVQRQGEFRIRIQNRVRIQHRTLGRAIGDIEVTEVHRRRIGHGEAIRRRARDPLHREGPRDQRRRQRA